MDGKNIFIKTSAKTDIRGGQGGRGPAKKSTEGAENVRVCNLGCGKNEKNAECLMAHGLGCDNFGKKQNEKMCEKNVQNVECNPKAELMQKNSTKKRRRKKDPAILDAGKK